jgi:hypothetical protein
MRDGVPIEVARNVDDSPARQPTLQDLSRCLGSPSDRFADGARALDWPGCGTVPLA